MKLTRALLLLLLVAPLSLGAVPAAALAPRLDINDVLAYISELFPVDVALDAAAGLVGAADETLAALLGYATTYDDLEKGRCGDLVVLFARGTDEPGNVGALVGPAFIEALGSALLLAAGGGDESYTVTAQGVGDYDASVTSYLEGGSAAGSLEMCVSRWFYPPTFSQ